MTFYFKVMVTPKCFQVPLFLFAPHKCKEIITLTIHQWWTRGGEVGGGSPSRDLDPPCYSPSQITASPTQPFLSWTPLPGKNFTPLPQKF